MMDRDFLISQLQTISVLLALLPTEALEQHVKEARTSIQQADSIGVMLDPTGWMRSMADGSRRDAENQLDIVEALLKARQAIDVREAFVTSLKDGA